MINRFLAHCAMSQEEGGGLKKHAFDAYLYIFFYNYFCMKKKNI